MREEWRGFRGTKWVDEVNVRDFIQNNYTPYDGDESFLTGPTEATNTLWGKLQELQRQERAKGGVLDMDVYVNTLNLIHYMHDKYFYEAAEMALIDTDVRRTFATGIAGFSHVIDSICAVKSAEAILREGVSFI